MNTRRTSILALCLTAGLSLTACSSSSDSGTSTPVTHTAPKPVAKIAVLTGKQTSVLLDAGFMAALTSLKVTPGTVGTATLTAGSLNFPITGGNVTYYKPGTVSPYVQGRILHTGSGLSLTAGGKKVELTDFIVDPGTSVLTGKVTVDGTVAVAAAPLFKLDGRTLKPLQSNPDGTATLTGTEVLLTKAAAGLLNQTFGITAITEDLKVGVATIVVDGK